MSNSSCETCGAAFQEEPDSAGPVRVLSPEENQNFQGSTINSPEEGEPNYNYSNGPFQQGAYFKRIHFNLNKTGLIQKLLIGSILLFLALLFLPLILLILAFFGTSLLSGRRRQ